MNLKRFSVVAAFLMILSSGPASATVLLTEDFDFSGTITGTNGWLAHSGVATNSPATTTGLTFAGYVGSGIGNAADIDDTGEDINKYLSSNVTSGAVYASFMLNVTSASAGYFMHFGQNNAGVMNTSALDARLFTTSDGTGDYELGLTFRLGTTPTTSGTDRTTLDLVFGTTYLVVLKYNIVVGADNDEVSLFVFSSPPPASEPTPTLGPLLDTEALDGDLTGVQAIALRQFTAAQRQIVDGIRVTDTWADSVPVELVHFTIE